MTRNTRPTFVEWRGERRKLTDLCREYGTKRSTVDSRLAAGWTLEEAVRTPMGACRVCWAAGRETMVLRKRRA